MVSSSRKALRQPLKQALAIVKNLTRFAMHERWSADDLASKDFADRLMAKTHTEYRNGLVKMPDHIFCNSGVRRRAGAGGNNNSGRFQPFNFFEGDFVVAKYAQFLAELAQVLHEVICK